MLRLGQARQGAELQIFGVAVWPFILMVSTYVAYQLALKLTRPDVNVLGLLTLAYLCRLLDVPAHCGFAIRIWVPIGLRGAMC